MSQGQTLDPDPSDYRRLRCECGNERFVSVTVGSVDYCRWNVRRTEVSLTPCWLCPNCLCLISLDAESNVVTRYPAGSVR